MLAEIRWANSQGGAILPAIIPTLSNGARVQDVGRNIIKWGSAEEDAAFILANMTPTRAREILAQVPASDIRAIGDWYRSVAATLQAINSGVLKVKTPMLRAEMMDEILRLGGVL
jgi:hypothetical protein